MTKIVVSIYEKSEEEALAAVRDVGEADAIELRVDGFSAPRGRVDYAAFRALTPIPLIATRRGARFDAEEAARAFEAGFDLVDVEYDEGLAAAAVAPFRDRAILSFHDFEGMPDLERLIPRMASYGTAHVKIAATPRSFDENVVMLDRLARSTTNLTLFGMGAAGLYSRILAPYFGSSLSFVGLSDQRGAAPGQFSLARGLLYWGDPERMRQPDAIFAVVGNPIGHSLSPAIHNPRFRELGVDAAYSIAEVPELEHVAQGLAEARPFYPTGISITAPFKEDGFRFASAAGASMSPRAQACRAINTLVRRLDGTLVADNTDVEGVAAAFRSLGRTPKRAAVLGAGGSARAVLVALREVGASARMFVRNPEKVELDGFPGVGLAPLASLAEFEGDLLVNTISADVVVPYPAAIVRSGLAIIDMAYTKPRLEQLDESRSRGAETADGLAILEGQASAQSKLFMLAVPGVRA
jgi:3-dehydroquinate dehydratase/shikimate dehydrogenase